MTASLTILVSFVLVSLTLTAPVSAASHPCRQPKILWVWERPEDMSRFDVRENAFAVLYGTVESDGSETRVIQRRNGVKLPPDGCVLPVIHVRAKPGLPLQREPLVYGILEAVDSIRKVTKVEGLQLDFDVTSSQMEQYREILLLLRSELMRREIPFLSVTALVWNCSKGNWGVDLPVDEIVPMYFAMGPAIRDLERSILKRGILISERCQESVGLTSPPPALFPKARQRYYFFSYRPWSLCGRSFVSSLPLPSSLQSGLKTENSTAPPSTNTAPR